MSKKVKIDWDGDDTASPRDLPRKVELNKTAAGKTIQAVRDTYGLWKIEFGQGGEIPAQLSGRYMTLTEAEWAIKVYING